MPRTELYAGRGRKVNANDQVLTDISHLTLAPLHQRAILVNIRHFSANEAGDKLWLAVSYVEGRSHLPDHPAAPRRLNVFLRIDLLPRHGHVCSHALFAVGNVGFESSRADPILDSAFTGTSESPLNLDRASRWRTSHGEKNHQGIDNRLIEPTDRAESAFGTIRCAQRLGGMLRFYHRAAA